MNLILQAIKSAINGVYAYVNKNRSDWNQNDPTAPDFLKNKPFWEDDPVETDLIQETTYEWTTLGFSGALKLDPIEIVENTIYKVYWDGVEYECTSYYSETVDFVCIGNSGIGDVDGFNNNEPFFITVYDGKTLVFANSVGSHTFKVVKFVIGIHKIDNKYIDFSETTAVKKYYYENGDKITQTVSELSIPTLSYAQSSNDLWNCEIAYNDDGCLTITAPYMMFATINSPSTACDISNLDVNATSEIINSSNFSARKIYGLIGGTCLIYITDEGTTHQFYISAVYDSVCNTMSGKWIKTKVVAYENGVKVRITRIK